MLWRIALLISLGCTGPLLAGQTGVRPELHRQRKAATDLEVSGLIGGLPHGESRFVTRGFLLSLPRITVHLDQFEDFPALSKPGVMVTGVDLEVLAARLGAAFDDASAMEAICRDGYAAAYPVGYIRFHHPIFVLAIDGLSPHAWAVKHHAYDAGPYFIAYAHFEPHFRILAHDDRPLEPDQITKLLFSTKEAMYAGIEPREARETPLGVTPVVAGFRIARQNCFRCHNSGEYGGSQSGISWKKLGKIARERPQYFADWVHDPRTIDPQAKMPANLDYDQATLDAITKYFAVVTLEGQ